MAEVDTTMPSSSTVDELTSESIRVESAETLETNSRLTARIHLNFGSVGGGLGPPVCSNQGPSTPPDTPTFPTEASGVSPGAGSHVAGSLEAGSPRTLKAFKKTLLKRYSKSAPCKFRQIHQIRSRMNLPIGTVVHRWGIRDFCF
jgi:hypothetical protein